MSLERVQSDLAMLRRDRERSLPRPIPTAVPPGPPPTPAQPPPGFLLVRLLLFALGFTLLCVGVCR